MRRLLKYALATAVLVATTSPKGIGAIHSVTAKLDSTDLLMGNVTTLHIQAVADDTDGQLLLSGDTITQAVEYRAVDYKGASPINDGKHRLDYEVTIQAFDSGPHPIPPIPFVQGIDTAYTQPLTINVNIPLGADTIKDVSNGGVDVLDAPNASWTDDLPDAVANALDYWPWILAGLVIAAGIIIAIIMMRRRRIDAAEAEAQLPPYQWAMLKLNEIRTRKMFAPGQERQYYTTLTEILRIYLMRRFDINAMEMTSSQIMASLPIDEPGVSEGQPMLREVLCTADFVKFAKLTPSPDDNVRAFNDAVQFVELTRPIEVAQPSETSNPTTDPKSTPK